MTEEERYELWKKLEKDKKAKSVRAKVRKGLRAKGLISQGKKRLNRKEFIKEAIEDWNFNADENTLEYLEEAIIIMLRHRGGKLESVDFIMPRFREHENVTLEAIGVAKVLRIALRLQKLYERVKKQGYSRYEEEEKVECIKDIYEA